MFNRRNQYPECIFNEWSVTPQEGERIEVDYGTSTSSFVWWINGKFVNVYGFELYNIVGWRSLNLTPNQEGYVIKSFSFTELQSSKSKKYKHKSKIK